MRIPLPLFRGRMRRTPFPVVCCALLTAAMACSRTPDRQPPSILLFVYDTVRHDAVSAYGRVRTTTPTFDRLARQGVLYLNAYANAPWTLPSHVSLFTGLLPHEHRVGSELLRAPDDLLMLAEILRQRGYQTVGMSENPWVSDEFNLAQGFDSFVQHANQGPSSFTATLDKLLEGTDTRRPLFVFVNVMDAHGPYGARQAGDFLPPPVSPKAANALGQRAITYLCDPSAPAGDLALLWDMYLGGVAKADAKLARAYERVVKRTQHNLVTIATADHGQHFGEHQIMGHQYSVREPVIRIPLLVHGLPGVRAARVLVPVSLRQVTASIQAWTAGNIGVGGGTLPVTNSGRRRNAIRAEYADTVRGPLGNQHPLFRALGMFRARCPKDMPVFGNMGAVIDQPFKLLWFDQYPPLLYNLKQDPTESTNIADSHPELVRELLAAREEVPSTTETATAPEADVPQDVLERLRALGYADTTTPH